MIHIEFSCRNIVTCYHPFKLVRKNYIQVASNAHKRNIQINVHSYWPNNILHRNHNNTQSFNGMESVMIIVLVTSDARKESLQRPVVEVVQLSNNAPDCSLMCSRSSCTMTHVLPPYHALKPIPVSIQNYDQSTSQRCRCYTRDVRERCSAISICC